MENTSIKERKNRRFGMMLEALAVLPLFLPPAATGQATRLDAARNQTTYTITDRGKSARVPLTNSLRKLLLRGYGHSRMKVLIR